LSRQRAAQQLAHQCESVAFVLSERTERPERRLIHHLRVVRRFAFGIDEHTVGHRLTLQERNAHLAERDRRRRHVEHDWRRTFLRNDAAERIRRHAPLATAPRRNLRFVTNHVREVDRDETRATAWFAIRADPAEVVSVAEAYTNN